MTENRYRPSSSPPRRYADPRSSFISTSFDPARYSSSSQPRSVVDTFPVTRHGSVYSTQGIAKRQVLDDTHPGGGSIVRTEYAVRPRTNSTLEPVRRPISTFTERRSSPPRSRPAIISGSSRDDPRSPVLPPAQREERYLVPAASAGRHHHRHASATRAEQERLQPARINRPPEYHRRGGYNAYPSYSSSRAPLPDEGFSYTTPKEQFLSDSSRPVQRRDSYSRRERPISMMGPPEYRLPARRDVRDAPPPSSARALDRIERTEPSRSNGRSSDIDDRDAGIPRRRHSTRAPVLHHYPEDGYTSNRDDRDLRPIPRPRHERLDDDDRAPKHRHREDRERDSTRDFTHEPDRVRERDRDREKERDRDRERDRLREPERSGKPRSRDSSPEHSAIRKGITAAAVGAVGAAAGAAIKSARTKDDVESGSDDRKDRKERKHRRRRHHHDGEETSPDELAGRVDRDLKITNGDRDHRRREEDRRAEDVEDEEGRHDRRKHHRHRKHKERSDKLEESDTTEDYDAKETRHRRSDREKGEDHRDAPRHRERTFSRDEERDVPPNLETRTISPGEDEDGRPRKVQLVEPAEKKEDIKPKGILKPPRAVPFPEDPNPTREGVAPLKDAQKDGIPANARWTKISRALVNPEALEQAHERYEEREDYVIILRVVSREDIMKLAEKTKEIRGMYSFQATPCE
jgi:zinc finger CCCH domain-containing protein 13